MKLAELAQVLGAACHGDQEQEIIGVEGIEKAGPGQLTFVANPKYTPFARTTKAGAVLVTEDFEPITAPTLRTPNPYLAFARAVEIFHPSPRYAPGIHATAVVDPSATIGTDVHIGAYVVVGADAVVGPGTVLLPHVVIYPSARLGKNCLVHAHAVVRESCRLGDGVVLQNGAVVGSDGFGFAKEDSGRWHKITQSGAVTLGDEVEVQANSCIDRASVGNTEIARGVKIDNLVQIGHGSRVGEDTLICAQVGLAGSSGVGKNVVLAGQVGVVGHSFIGDGVVVTAQSGVPGDVPPGSVISGSPAFEHRRWLRSVAAFSRLPDLVKQMNKKT
ncbi:MAG TPA: UDP-3-O-(3-hydroxymyristoyl)glucosamine N-acyltransferase [Acidobacteriaceae bacterium]|nr:UDP-3-O-(3-hydroxymyristoyl)glucosamine N-acyltransferase [Acidobacteriaceae bacterium]